MRELEGYYPCIKVKDSKGKNRKTNSIMSGYRYGCDLCPESLFLRDDDKGG